MAIVAGQPTLGQTPFAAVDIETTGIYPGGRDRIIEVAVVRTAPTLEIQDEWTTLVNPRRDIGRSDIHGIQAADVALAPTFDEVAANLGMRLSGAVIVAHNLRFDLRFLGAEYGRCGAIMPEHPGLCTLDLAFRFLPDAPSRKLTYCCAQAGVLHEEEHTALGDAKATAQLLARFFDMAREEHLTSLEDLGCGPLRFPPSHWLAPFTPTGRRYIRAVAAKRREDERTYLARLVQRMAADEARSPREAEYLALVDRALEDRRIAETEAKELARVAEAWGMTRQDVLEAHRAYLASLSSEALADAHITDAELRDLREVCDLLGLHRATLDVLLSAPEPHRPIGTMGTPGSLRGQSVCFTGELHGVLKGQRVSRELAEKLAADAGLDVRSSVTKKLSLLVVADPDTQSLKARKAREYGVRIMAEAAFWGAIGLSVK